MPLVIPRATPPLRHVPALFLATTFTFGGMMPLWNAPGAIREFGLPPHIQFSPAAHSCFIVYGSRMTMYGLAIWSFYVKGQLKAIDTLLGLLVYAGAVDAYVCYREGEKGRAVFRAAASVLFGGLGLLGVTAG